MNQDRRMALLIDADNVSPSYIKVIMDETTARGIVTYKRIYDRILEKMAYFT